GDLEPYRSAGLLLADRRTLNGVSGWGNVLDFESDDIATTQLAIDGEIEQRQVALAVCHLKLSADRPDVLRPQRRLGSGQLALVPRGALGCSRGWFFAVLHIILLICENDQHGLNSTAPALRSASAYGGGPAAPALVGEAVRGRNCTPMLTLAHTAAFLSFPELWTARWLHPWLGIS